MNGFTISDGVRQRKGLIDREEKEDCEDRPAPSLVVRPIYYSVR
ncbi:MAG TPA: hypothetical protein VGQ40_00180 [Chthoniobacterales bacterium]|nr:hypothetical protein [Chthoniobacterales bacterium]